MFSNCVTLLSNGINGVTITETGTLSELTGVYIHVDGEHRTVIECKDGLMDTIIDGEIRFQ